VAIQKKCQDLFSKETAEIIHSNSFMEISQRALSSFLDVNETNTVEFVLFLRIKQWMQQKCEEEKVIVNGENMRRIIGDALWKIRFPTMTSQQFANSVSTIDGLMSDKEMIQVFKKISVFDNDDIDCPFSNKFRCKISEFSGAISDMLELCDAPIIFDYISEQRCNLNTVFRNWKDSVDGGELDISTVSIVLQCCADLANTIEQKSCATPTNKDIRKELYNDFKKWKEIAKTKNATDTMTKFMDMRKNLNKLCRWSF